MAPPGEERSRRIADTRRRITPVEATTVAWLLCASTGDVDVGVCFGPIRLVLLGDPT